MVREKSSRECSLYVPPSAQVFRIHFHFRNYEKSFCHIKCVRVYVLRKPTYFRNSNGINVRLRRRADRNHIRTSFSTAFASLF